MNRAFPSSVEVNNMDQLLSQSGVMESWDMLVSHIQYTEIECVLLSIEAIDWSLDANTVDHVTHNQSINTVSPGFENFVERLYMLIRIGYYHPYYRPDYHEYNQS